MNDARKGTLKVLKTRKKIAPVIEKRTYRPNDLKRFNVVNTVTRECTLIEDQTWRTLQEKENACRENNITMLSELIKEGLLDGEALERAKKSIHYLKSALNGSGSTLKAVH